MHISTLVLDQFRNIQSAELLLSPGINLLLGDNGAGKSSVLEAIYVLSYGRSFRSHPINCLIQKGREAFTLFSILETESQAHKLGFKRSECGQTDLLLNGHPITALSTLSQLVPSLLLSAASYRYFTDGPKLRRSFLNWGLFYGEPRFPAVWQQFQHALKQRNSALKQALPTSEIGVWDPLLIESGEKIHQYRQAYLAQLTPLFDELMQYFLPTIPLTLSYERGWALNHSLGEALSRHKGDDYRLGYTYRGPQRADLQVQTQGIAAHHHLSQGQQKMAAYALYLAQGQLLQKQQGSPPIFLLDDLPSELDGGRLIRMSEVLQALKAQVLVTAISEASLPTFLWKASTASVFQVQAGEIQEKD